MTRSEVTGFRPKPGIIIEGAQLVGIEYKAGGRWHKVYPDKERKSVTVDSGTTYSVSSSDTDPRDDSAYTGKTGRVRYGSDIGTFPDLRWSPEIFRR